MEELINKSKEELIKIILQRELAIKSQVNSNINKLSQIRHFRIRLKKIRNSLDYLLLHPYSNDTGYVTKKHKREEHSQESKTRWKNKILEVKNEFFRGSSLWGFYCKYNHCYYSKERE